MDLQPITSSPDVKSLLAANALPIDDLDDPAIELVGAFVADRLVGVVGVQWLDGTALLRSLAVEPAARARGIGAMLCAAAERAVRDRALRSVWLLTTSARDYFAQRGYAVTPRDEVPDAVRATAQFSSLCPASAVAMRRVF